MRLTELLETLDDNVNLNIFEEGKSSFRTKKKEIEVKYAYTVVDKILVDSINFNSLNIILK